MGLTMRWDPYGGIKTRSTTPLGPTRHRVILVTRLRKVGSSGTRHEPVPHPGPSQARFGCEHVPPIEGCHCAEVEIPNEGYTQRVVACPTSMVRNIVVRVPKDETPRRNAVVKRVKRKKQPIEWL